ncbi:hypothetical protein D3C81_1779580 [compost metagenome]
MVTFLAGSAVLVPPFLTGSCVLWLAPPLELEQPDRTIPRLTIVVNVQVSALFAMLHFPLNHYLLQH